MGRIRTAASISLLASLVSACGTYVPAKHLLKVDLRFGPETSLAGESSEGRAEADIVSSIRCEIQKGVYETSVMTPGGKNYVSYMKDGWGTQVTLKLIWDEQSSGSPGLSFIHPFSGMQSRTIGVGGSASAHATRVETVTFLFENPDLYRDEMTWVQNINGDNPSHAPHDCKSLDTGTMIHSDLKIDDFIVDKATIASTGIVSTNDPSEPPFSVFQEELTFVGAYSGNITPTWKLTRFANNTSGNLVGATRTTTGDVLITLGPLVPDPKHPGQFSHKLSDQAQAQHTAAFGGGATASQITSQSH
jgi:hypothetical protein